MIKTVNNPQPIYYKKKLLKRYREESKTANNPKSIKILSLPKIEKKKEFKELFVNTEIEKKVKPVPKTQESSVYENQLNDLLETPIELKTPKESEPKETKEINKGFLTQEEIKSYRNTMIQDLSYDVLLISKKSLG